MTDRDPLQAGLDALATMEAAAVNTMASRSAERTRIASEDSQHVEREGHGDVRPTQYFCQVQRQGTMCVIWNGVLAATPASSDDQR